MTKEMILIIIGIIIIIVSFMISEKRSTEEEQEKLDLEELKTVLKSEIIENIKLEQDTLQKQDGVSLEDKRTDILDGMEEEMSKLSNEKIMAFTEYGEEILGKIELNHQEVVFLYDMLNQKESEMKQLVKEVDSSKTNLEEMIVDVKDTEKKWKAWKTEKEEIIQELARKEIALQKAVAEEKRLTEGKIDETKGETEENTVFTTSDTSNMEPSADMAEEISIENTQEDTVSDDLENNENSINESVLELHSQGMSVMEIAKVLGRGQGEVRLIIDLYQG